jgi:hypothetical protein
LNITCDKCSYVITLSAQEVQKVPPGKQATVICPKCERKFSVSFGKPNQEAANEKGVEKSPSTTAKVPKTAKKENSANASDSLFGFVEDEGPVKASKGESGVTGEAVQKKNGLGDMISSDIYDASDKPFDFVEEEGKTALVCESNPKLKESIIENLNLMEYHITEVENSRSALKRMRYHVYDVVVVNENFDTSSPDSNVVLIYLERLNMAVRRHIFIAMISDRFRTMDNMVALQKSVDIVINAKNIDDAGKILSRGVTDKDFFYRAFRDTLLGTGI